MDINNKDFVSPEVMKDVRKKLELGSTWMQVASENFKSQPQLQADSETEQKGP